MKHLGIDIIWSPAREIYFADIGKDKYIHENYDNLKRDVIRLVLPTYKPTKALAWLEEQTDYEWFYNDRAIQCEINDYVYFLDDGICYIDKNGYLIIEDGIVESFEAKLTPREFIEKIAKGEWI